MKKVVYLTLLVVTLASCGRTEKKITPANKVIAVTIQKVELKKNSTILRYSGTIEASQTIPLTFQASGTIEEIYIDEGDAVKKGQILATVDKSDLQNIYNAS